MLNISGLNEGVVIDHIQAGGAMKIYEYLNLEKLDCQVAIIKNARSEKILTRAPSPGKNKIKNFHGSFQ